jgi:uncharacterized Tic20 family protein
VAAVSAKVRGSDGADGVNDRLAMTLGMHRSRLAGFLRDWAMVVLLGALAVYGMAKVGEDVFAHESMGFDIAVQRWMLAHEYPWLVRVFIAITTIGSVGPMCALALGGAAYLWYDGRRRIAAIVLVAPVAAPRWVTCSGAKGFCPGQRR